MLSHMNKTVPSLTIFLVLLLTLISCGPKKPYAEYLKDERRAIDLFIAQNQLKILDKFPENRKFGKKNSLRTLNSVSISR